MPTIAIYSKDDAGIITYIGVKDWTSRQQVLDHYMRADETPHTETARGWPHPSITWHGNIGFGEP